MVKDEGVCLMIDMEYVNVSDVGSSGDGVMLEMVVGSLAACVDYNKDLELLVVAIVGINGT